MKPACMCARRGQSAMKHRCVKKKVCGLEENMHSHLLLNLKDSYFEPAVGSPPNFARMCGYRPY